MTTALLQSLTTLKVTNVRASAQRMENNMVSTVVSLTTMADRDRQGPHPRSQVVSQVVHGIQKANQGRDFGSE